MTMPLQLTFREVQRQPEIEQFIQRKVDKLEQCCEQIVGVQVLVDMPHRHHHKGRFYHVRVAIELPGREVVASRQAMQTTDGLGLHHALAEAFDTARRELKAHLSQHRRSANRTSTRAAALALTA